MVAIKRILAALAPLTIMLFTVTAIANQSGSGYDGNRTVQLRESVLISGVTIQPGSYTLTWSRRSGSDEVRIAIARGRNVLATATGRWVETAQPSPYEALVYQTARGANELTGILFERSAGSIRIDADTARADSGRASGSETH
jgi:hypothetical protein